MEDSVFNNTSVAAKSPRFEKLPGLLSSHDYDVVRIVLLCVIDPLLLLFGITSNAIDMHVFCKMGARDTVTVSFLALAISDLAYLIIGVPETVCFLPSHFFSKSFHDTIDMSSLGIFISRWKQIFYNFSIFTPTFVSVTRCFCVTFPLQFGEMFTRFRTIVVLSVAFVAFVVLYIPILSFHGMKNHYDPRRNLTRLWIYFAPEYAVLQPIHAMLFRNVFVNICFMACCISTVILIINLKSAARTRREITGWKQTDAEPSTKITTQTAKTAGTHTENSTNEDGQTKCSGSRLAAKTFSSRDTQVIKSVIFVTLMFICTHIPVVVFSELIKLFEPEFRYLGRYSNSLLSSAMLARSGIFLSSACNILIYFNFNTKFRETLKALYCGPGRDYDKQ
ncbi:neuromedin-U receptor 1-like [Aplysia californica]|uniref:Neuromedin-U receptor 1-like n=1 Tax=Aplysia californica TaxID=6500 RepID=A0ABM0JSB5_APLCA|nr:neuromedin-U receptor 1-like [Aplysia californica]